MNKQDEILLERYFNQELSVAESAEFEAKIEQDKVFAEAYQLRMRMQIFLKERKKQAQFTGFLEGVSNSYFEERKEKSIEQKTSLTPVWKRPKVIIGTLAVAATIAGTLLFPFLSSPDLYEQFNEHRPLALVQQSSEVSNDLASAEKTFNTSDFQAAKIALTEYLITNPNDVEAQLYQGICLLELDQNEEATLIFERIATRDSLLQTEALWYWALSYLKQGDTEMAKAKLNQLINEDKDPELRKRAENLSSKLD